MCVVAWYLRHRPEAFHFTRTQKRVVYSARCSRLAICGNEKVGGQELSGRRVKAKPYRWEMSPLRICLPATDGSGGVTILPRIRVANVVEGTTSHIKVRKGVLLAQRAWIMRFLQRVPHTPGCPLLTLTMEAPPNHVLSYGEPIAMSATFQHRPTTKRLVIECEI